MTENKVTVLLTPKQTLAFELLSNDQDIELLYGGAKGGAKSFLFCVWVKTWAEHLIKLFDLKPSANPLPIGFVGRKRSIDFKDTTLESFKQIIPADHYRLHDDEHEIIFHETVKVFCGGLDDPKRVEKFNSQNLAFFAIDQAEETDRNDVAALKASLRLTIKGVKPPFKALYTANPADCWLKTDFIDNPQPGHIFVPALYTDNPHLPANYRETLESAFKHNDALLRAYRDGDWSSLQASNVLITTVMLSGLKDVIHHPKSIKRIVTCDPALGGDECVIYVIENGKIVDKKVLHVRDAMIIAGEMVVIGNLWKCPNFAIDYSGGLGHAIANRISEVKPSARVYIVNSSESAADEEAFVNARAEMYWKTMVKVQNKEIPYPEDEELRRQLSSIRFKVVNSNGKIQLEPKQDTKSRLGRSPDESDAFVIGLYKIDLTDPIVIKDGWQEDYHRCEVGGGATSAMTA